MESSEFIEPESQHDGRLYFDGGETEEEFHQREEEPQGQLYYTRYDSVPIMVDALFGAPSSREFTTTELAEKAGLDPRSVRDRIDILHELGVVKQVEGTDRVTLDLDGAIAWKLRELDGLIKRAQGGSEPPKRDQETADDSAEPAPEVGDVDQDSYEVMDSVREQAVTPQHHAD